MIRRGSRAWRSSASVCARGRELLRRARLGPAARDLRPTGGGSRTSTYNRSYGLPERYQVERRPRRLTEHLTDANPRGHPPVRKIPGQAPVLPGHVRLRMNLTHLRPRPHSIAQQVVAPFTGEGAYHGSTKTRARPARCDAGPAAGRRDARDHARRVARGPSRARSRSFEATFPNLYAVKAVLPIPTPGTDPRPTA